MSDLADQSGQPGTEALERVMTTRAFMEANCAAEDLAETTTASGYNPLLQDFANTRFYVT